MRKRNKTIIRITALAIAVAMPVTTAVYSFADEAGEESGQVSKYEKPNINDLTGHGEEPEELSVSAAATYQEKAWYEYVTYSDEAVCSYRLSDDARLLFYDPYTYTNSMIMDVQNDATTTEMDTMSSYTISTTRSKTISAASESTYTNTNSTQTSGRDKTYSLVQNTGTTTTELNHKEKEETTGTVKDVTDYEYVSKEAKMKSTTDQIVLLEELKFEVGLQGGVSSTTTVGRNVDDYKGTSEAWVVNKETHTTEYSDNYSTSTNYSGTDTTTYNTESETTGWTELSARITKTLGSSNSICQSWSETESTTVTKTYVATHFASDGITPLPWAIVHYTVQMPMKCCLQYKMGGEWVTTSMAYCLLTTVQGTCRTWMENGQAYYEDWGNGEPVTATNFWSQFLTKDQLMNAYSNKLYPVGGYN